MAGESKTLTVGESAEVLDIYLSANGAAVTAQYVGFELFDASNTSAGSGVASNPSAGKYTANGTVPAGFQVGDWRIDWTVITQSNNLLTASENFCVQDVNLTVGFVPPDDKFSDIYEAVRLDIGDPDGLVFNDAFMERNLKKAVRRLNHRLGLSPNSRPKGIPGNFGGPRLKVSPIVADYSAGTITPNNDELCDLVIMQMELIILESEVSALKRLAATSNSGPYANLVGTASQDGITVKNADGVEVTVSPARLMVRADLHKFDVKNRRDELEKMIRAFLNRMTGNFGKMVW